jgi:ribosomal protein S18 acetylase RimI-like enzyme
MTIELATHPGFTIRELSAADFRPIWQTYAPRIFEQPLRLHLDDLLSEPQKENAQKLQQNMGSPMVLRYGLYHGDTFVGWHIGDQKSSHEYYMRNSAVLPEYRHRGLYSALVGHVLAKTTEAGFQLITSRHTATNNPVIIAKLKLGFVITGVEISDVFGVLVHLTYFTNNDRRRVMDVRSGESRPDADIQRWLGLAD